jgi:hypothetical protein
MSAVNGTASPTILRVLDEAIEREISADNGVRIVFVSVDGDESDTSDFNECFTTRRVTIRFLWCDGGELMEAVISMVHSGSVTGFVCSQMHGRAHLPHRYVQIP